jgi:hypothetical protein
MKGNRCMAGAGRLGAPHFEVHDDWVLTAADDDGFASFIRPCIDLLMWDVGRNIDEVAWAGFPGEFEVVSPAHAAAAANNIEDGFKLAMVVRPGLGIGFDDYRASPELAGPRAGVRDRGGASHSGSLGSVGVEIASRDDFDSVVEPITHTFTLTEFISKFSRNVISLLCYIGIRNSNQFGRPRFVF